MGSCNIKKNIRDNQIMKEDFPIDNNIDKCSIFSNLKIQSLDLLSNIIPYHRI